MSQYRMTLVNRLGEGRSVLLGDSDGDPWTTWDKAAQQSALYRFGCLIDLHDGRVMALFADGGVVPHSQEPLP